MVSTVRQRPNHYETLGLAPGASDADIAEAFARELRRTRPFGDIAQVSIAHQLLRDPVKRRAYDESLGIVAKPEPVQSTEPPAPARQTIFETRPQTLRQAAQATATERTTGGFIAASLREPATDVHVSDIPPASPPRREEPAPEQQFVQSERIDLEAGFTPAEASPIPWKKIGIAAGVMILAGGLLGVWTGPDTGEAAAQAEPERGVTVALPEAKAGPSATTSLPPALIAEATEPSSEPPVRAAATIDPAESAKAPEAATETTPPTEIAQADTVAADQPAETVAPATVVPASMPLPNKTIARTIGRIGYACGDVASVAEGGAPGVFKVTCTSGSSYRAAPIRGRYHFSRWRG